MKFILLIAAYLILMGLTVVLDRRIARHLGKRHSGWIYLFVAGIAGYYLIDTLLLVGFSLSNPYLWLWLTLLVSELILFFRHVKTRHTD